MEDQADHLSGFISSQWTTSVEAGRRSDGWSLPSINYGRNLCGQNCRFKRAFGCTGRDGVVYYIHCTLAQLLGSWPDLLALMILQITTSELIRSKPGLIPLCVDYRRHVNSAELTSRTVCLTNARRVCIGRPIVACRVYRHNSLQVSVGTFPNSHYITWYMKSRESPAEHKNWGCT